MKKMKVGIYASALAFVFCVGGIGSASAAVPTQVAQNQFTAYNNWIPGNIFSLSGVQAGAGQYTKQVMTNQPVQQSVASNSAKQSAPGQMKQSTLAQSAKAFAPGQLKQNAASQSAAQYAPGQQKKTWQFQNLKQVQPGLGINVILTQNTDLLELLNLTAAELTSELKEGNTLAEIADEQNVDVDEVIELLVEQEKERIEDAVDAGKLTEAQADQIEAGLEERVENFVENYTLNQGNLGLGTVKISQNTELLDLLNLTASELQSELSEGNTLAEIAEDQGVNVDDVIDLLVDQIEEKLDAVVDTGKLTETQADTIKDSLETHVKNFVNGSYKY